MKERLGVGYKDQSFFFDQMRRKRNRIIYEISNLVSSKEAEEALVFAEEYIKNIEEIVNRQPGLDL